MLFEFKEVNHKNYCQTMDTTEELTLQSENWWLGCKTNDDILTFSVFTCFSSFLTDHTQNGHAILLVQAQHKAILNFQKIIGTSQESSCNSYSRQFAFSSCLDTLRWFLLPFCFNSCCFHYGS